MNFVHMHTKFQLLLIKNLLVACYTTQHPAMSVRRSLGRSPFLGSGPEGADDLCFHIGGNFSFSSSSVPPPLSKLKSQFGGSNPSLEAHIPISRLKSQTQGSNPSLKAQIPVSRLKSQSWGSYPSLKAQILALRLKSEPWGSHPRLKAHIPAEVKTA